MSDKTLNGSDLNNLSTKAIFGDDSVCLNATEESKENEPLKSTNPFATSQVPHFVPDHFSDFGFQPLNDDSEFNSDPANKPADTPNFSNGIEVDEEICTKQDSTLMKESPEPCLYNGKVEHDDISSEKESNGPVCEVKESEANVTSEQPLSPSDRFIDQTSDLIPDSEYTDQGPETCVDSESDDDVLVSPSKREKDIKFEESFTKQLVDEAFKIDTLNENPAGVDLDGEIGLQKDEGNNIDVCPMSSENSLLSDIQNKITKDLTEKEELNEISETTEEKQDFVDISYDEATPVHTEDIVLINSAAEEVCSRQEVNEDLICPMKEPVVFNSNESNGEALDGGVNVDSGLMINDTHYSEGEPILSLQDDEAVYPSRKGDISLPIQEEDTSDIMEENIILHKESENKVSNVEESDVNATAPKEDVVSNAKENIENLFPHEEDFFRSLNKEGVNSFVQEQVTEGSKKEDVSFLDEEEITAFPLRKSEVDLSTQIEEHVSSPDMKEPEEPYSSNHFNEQEEEEVERPPTSPADFSKIADSLPPQRDHDFFNMDSTQQSENDSFLAASRGDNKICSFEGKTSEAEKFENVGFSHQIQDNADEMSSSMIDYGEEKSLPEAQSNNLNLLQDLKFDTEIQEKHETDSESDSGFEIINASEASTMQVETKIQSEKEAGAVDEKLLLDRNEAEVEKSNEVPTENKKPLLEPLESLEEVAQPVDVPATPPATPAPGLETESKEGLIAAVVAAAGIYFYYILICFF